MLTNSKSIKSEHQDAQDGVPAVEVSVVMPCLNEADTLETCIEKAGRHCGRRHLRRNRGGDNGSTDGRGNRGGARRPGGVCRRARLRNVR